MTKRIIIMLKSSCPNNEGIVSLLHKTGEWGALLLSVVTGLLFIIISPEVSNDFIKSTALVSLIKYVRPAKAKVFGRPLKEK